MSKYKKYIKKRTSRRFDIHGLFACLMLFTSILCINGIVLSPANKKIQDIQLDNLEEPSEPISSTEIIKLDVYTNDISIEEITAPNGDLYHQLGIDEGGVIGEVGYPNLPFKTLKVLLPHGKDRVSIDVQCGPEQVVEGFYNIIPAQELIAIGSGRIPEFSLKSSIYSSMASYPEKLYSVVGTYNLRGYKILVLNVFPVRYVPQTGMLSYFENMKVSVSVDDTEEENTFYRNLEDDEALVMNTIDNPEEINSYRAVSTLNDGSFMPLGLPTASYDYVIITSEALKNSAGLYTFQDLADLKNSNGIETTIVTTEEIYANYSGDDNQSKIRNFIIDAYQTWGIQYVLLGGDGDVNNLGGESEDPIIPTRYLYEGMQLPSDLYYAALDGNWNDDGDIYWGEPGEDDLLAEVYVGRAPVDSEVELSNFVMKTLAHEASGGDPYLAEALMVGEELGRTWGGDHKDEIKDGSSNWGYITEGFPSSYNVNTLYDRDLSPFTWGANDIITILNSNNVHVINHLGHSNSDYNMKMSNYNVEALTNDKYFFVYSQGCHAGAFDNEGLLDYDCIAEHFVSTSSGAFACIANSRDGWGSGVDTNGPSQRLDREFFDAIFGEGIEEIGRANQDSKEDTIGFISESLIRYCYYELNLFGDPTASIPSEHNNHAPILNSESFSPTSGYQDTELTFSVTYTDADGNEPSYVSVVIDGTRFPMDKVNPIDIIYTDGCDYQSSIFLQSSPNNYSYYFESGDGEHVVSTSVQDNIEIFYSNEQAPVLTGGIVTPQNGYYNASLFEFSVNYSDSDNNEPENIFVSINSTLFSMTRQDPLDSNYMDGNIYVFATMLEEIGSYSFEFACSDGQFIVFDGPYSGPYTEERLLFTGMHTNYTVSWVEKGAPPSSITISYSHDNYTIFDEITSSSHNSYKVDMATREYIENPNEYALHTPYWIFSDVTINDHVLMMSYNGGADRVCIVSDEILCNMPGLGLIEVLVLQDPRFEDAYLWYEKSTGILLNGTFRDITYDILSGLHFEFISTNAKVEFFQDLTPNADFAASETIIVEENSVIFNFIGSEGNGPATYFWDFGDGTYSTEKNPVHIYSASGIYTISLTVEDKYGDGDVEIKNNYITVVVESTLTVDFFVNATVIAEGESIQFTYNGSEGSGLTYFEWDFGDGSEFSHERNPMHIYDTPGVYSVFLLVRDVNGDISHIVRTAFIIVKDPNNPGIPGYNIFILFGVVAMVTVVLLIRRNKNLKIKL